MKRNSPLPVDRIAIVAAILPPEPGGTVNVPIQFWQDWLAYWHYEIQGALPETWPPTFIGHRSNTHDD